MATSITLRALVIAALVAVFAACAPDGGRAAGVERVADRVFLVRDRPGSATQFRMIVLAGCSDEAGGQCRGLAHYLEHLLLVGRNPEHQEIAMRMFAEGTANGWTNDRATVYLHRLPPRSEGPRGDLEKLFAFYAARLVDFSITDQDAERERRVVRQEHDQRVGSRPLARFARSLDRALLPDHPAGQWTIGTTEEIDRFTVPDARAFHQRWYVLDNVYFVVSGDIDADILRDIATRALADVPHRAIPPRTGASQPTVDAARTDLRETDREVRRASVLYKKLIAIPEPDILTNRAARAVLTGFLTSRLSGSPYVELVERQKLATGSIAVSIRRIAPQRFVLTMGADPAPDVSPGALLNAIASYVEGLTTNSPGEATVERLKTRFARDKELAAQEPARTFEQLVSWLAQRNRYEDLAKWPQSVAAVTPDDVAAIARGLSGPGRIVTGILAPAVDSK